MFVFKARIEERRKRHYIVFILGDPGAVSWVDKMSVVKVYCKIEAEGRRNQVAILSFLNSLWKGKICLKV